MKKKYLLLFIVTVFLTLSCSDQDKYKIKFTNNIGIDDHYELKGSMKALKSGDTLSNILDVDFKLNLKQKTLAKYDDGSSKLELSIDSIKYNSHQRSVEECQHIEKYAKNRSVSFKINDRGEVSKMDSLPSFSELIEVGLDLRKLFIKLQPVMPGFEIYEGITWEKEQLMPRSDSTFGHIYKWFRVEKIYKKNNKNFAKVKMNTKYNLEGNDVIASKDNKFILGSGLLIFNLDDGKLEQIDSEITGILNVLVQDNVENYKDSTKKAEIKVRQMLNMRRIQ